MTLLQLEYFCVLAKTLHFTRAAQELHVSQPSLSYAIRELEKELGVPLFERRNNTTYITIYGSMFLEYCTQVLSKLTEAKKVIRSLHDSSNGEIRFGYSYTEFQELLPNIIIGYEKISGRNKNLFRLRQGNAELLASLLLKGELDVTLSFGLEDFPQIESVPLHTQELFLVVPKSHPLAMQAACSLEDIAGYPLILLNRFMNMRKYIDSKFAECGVVPNVVAETNDHGMSLSLVEKEVGASIIPYSANRMTGDFAALHITNPEIVATVYLSYNISQAHPRQVDDFIQYIVKNFCNFKQPEDDSQLNSSIG